ncbi:MAG: 5-methyltetrahydropteroyltriglutamate--homocysteine S-methyltransferase [Alphaproteobacteria bacterium]
MADAPPFRAEHVGSLLRPPSLTAAFKEMQAGRLDAPGFKAAQDAAIAEAVKLQEDCGLPVVTDGEFRRISYWGHFLGPVAGLSTRNSPFRFRDDSGAEQPFLAPHAEAPVRRVTPISGNDFAYLKSVATVTPKVTMPTPSTFHFYGGSQATAPGLYPTDDDYFADLTVVFREEIADLASRGATYLQMDEVALAMLCDPQIREMVAADGRDPDYLIGRYVQAIAEAVADRPPGVVMGVHLCRGNLRGKYLSAGGYEPVAEMLFQAPVDVFFLEYDTERAGDFAPLRFLPKGKRAVLGLVSSKVPELESVDDLARRLDEAAKVCDLDQLSISPQCGFASVVSGNPVTMDDERKKLTRVVETAQRVWGHA